MRILVTGSTGFLGINLVKKLSFLGHEVFPWKRESSYVEMFDFNPEYVVHGAAEIYDEGKMFVANVINTHLLLKMLQGCKALNKIVYFGSSSEYGRLSRPSKETDRINPETMYEATKGCGTLLVQANCLKTNIPATIVRPYSIYGPFEKEHRFIPTIWNKFVNKQTLTIFPGAHDFLYVDDFVDGVAKILFSENEGVDIVNLGGGKCISNIEVVDTFEQIVGVNLKKDISLKTLHEYDSNFWCANISYALEKYNWSPQISLEQGLQKYIQWKTEN